MPAVLLFVDKGEKVKVPSNVTVVYCDSRLKAWLYIEYGVEPPVLFAGDRVVTGEKVWEVLRNASSSCEA